MKNNLFRNITLAFVTIFSLSSCNVYDDSSTGDTSSYSSSSETKFIEILNEDNLTIEVGEKVKIETLVSNLSEPITYSCDLTYIANFTLGDSKMVCRYYQGSTVVRVECGGYQDSITINVIPNPEPDFTISMEQTELTINKSYAVRSSYQGDRTKYIESSNYSMLTQFRDPFGNFRIQTYEKEGYVSFFVTAGDGVSNSILVHINSNF